METSRELWPATNRLLGRPELMEVARLMPAVFHDLPNIAFSDRFPELDSDSFLEKVDPRVTLADGSIVRFAEIEPARRSLMMSRPRITLGEETLEASWPESSLAGIAAPTPD